MQKWQLSEQELETYKQTLKQLLNLSLDYSQKLRNLQFIKIPSLLIVITIN